ncbi:MAG: Gmad2 immunoglobulin-like domain-containing protein [Candidatus Paceibacterota bacterium]
MEILKMIKNVFIVLLALGIAFILLGYVKEKSKVTENTQEEGQIESPEVFSVVSSKGVEIFLDNPLENEVVQSPLMIKGMAPGNWFFEASAPVVLTNWDGLIIGESYITAKGDWMTTEYVPFEGTLEFTNTEYGNYGFLILKKDNPSGEAEFDDAIEFKVLFK